MPSESHDGVTYIYPELKNDAEKQIKDAGIRMMVALMRSDVEAVLACCHEQFFVVRGPTHPILAQANFGGKPAMRPMLQKAVTLDEPEEREARKQGGKVIHTIHHLSFSGNAGITRISSEELDSEGDTLQKGWSVTTFLRGADGRWLLRDSVGSSAGMLSSSARRTSQPNVLTELNKSFKI